MAGEVGMPVQFETHRNCITNDLYATLCALSMRSPKCDFAPTCRISSLTANSSCRSITA